MRDKFQNLDLNLLRVLLVLGEECSTTRAAERLSLSQPAVSRLLARLRDHFGDPLFVKSGPGVLPTPLAQQLCEQLAPLCAAMGDALQNRQQFDPAELSGTLRVAIFPTLLSVIGAPLFLALRRQAPRLRLVLESWDEHTLDKLQRGELFCGLQWSVAHLPGGLCGLPLRQQHDVVVYLAADHPLLVQLPAAHNPANQGLSLAQVAGYPIAMTPNTFDSPLFPGVRRAWQAAGLRPEIALVVEQPQAIFDVLAGSELLFPALDCYASPAGIVRLPLIYDRDEAPPPPLELYCHQRHQADAQLLWLRQHCEQVVEELMMSERATDWRASDVD